MHRETVEEWLARGNTIKGPGDEKTTPQPRMRSKPDRERMRMGRKPRVDEAMRAQILERLARGETQVAIAASLGICQSTVSDIKNARRAYELRWFPMKNSTSSSSSSTKP